MTRETDDSIRRYARRHRLSPMAERELKDLLSTVLGGQSWSPEATSTTVSPAPEPGTLVTVSHPDDAPEPASAAVEPIAFFERYEDRGVIGRGGMGEVRRVYDRLLQRTLAVKILRWENLDDLDARARFLAEAQVNAQLQHPGIVAVHEQGALPDGRPWFTMKEVRGRTLSDAIRKAYRAAPHAPIPRRLIEVIARVCRTVAYAHAKGVVHRDIKPANIMLGEFGEVLIMDWGIARVGGEAVAPRPDSLPPEAVGAPVRRSVSLSGETRQGRIMGTPAYMSPEQARGEHDRVGPPADVYALGAVLYQVLAGQAPYQGTSAAVVGQVLAGPPEPIAAVRPRDAGPAPADLVELCARAMAREADDRPTADAMAGEIEAWLDGVLKSARARAVVAEADDMQPRIGALRGRVADLRRQARAILEPLPAHAPSVDKQPGWTLEDAARDLENEARLTEVRMLQTLRSALHIVPELPEAHQRLADYYRDQVLAAEARRDTHTARIYEELVRTHDQGWLCEWLAGDGRLTLETDPPGATVTAYRFEERDRRLVEVPLGELGSTPLVSIPLSRGSHMLVLEAEGHAPVRYPVDIGRGSHWDGIPPDGSEPYVIRLPKLGELGPDDIYVPAGWCIVGGDDDAVDSLSRRRVWLDGFVMRRYPVTNAEYIEFLDDLAAQSGPEAAARHLPRLTQGLVGGEAPQAVVVRGPNGCHAFNDGVYGWHWHPDWPVVLIDWHDAIAFAAWMTQRGDTPWRLCHGLEHEKAGRGVDGRHLPWGDYFELTWANVLNSHDQKPAPKPVGSVATDRSPFGVADLVGNVRIWCAGSYARDGHTADGERARLMRANDDATREIRGGCWHSSSYLGRVAGRFGASPDVRYNVLGLRLTRDLR